MRATGDEYKRKIRVSGDVIASLKLNCTSRRTFKEMWLFLGLFVLTAAAESNIPTPPDKTTECHDMISEKIKKSLQSTNFHDLKLQLRSSGVPLRDWLYSQGNFNVQKMARHPLINSWEGKRNFNPYKIELKIRRPARVPFNSWGGKRSNEDVDKSRQMTSSFGNDLKSPFNSWTAKQMMDYYFGPSADGEFKLNFAGNHLETREPSISDIGHYFPDADSLPEKQALEHLIN